MDRSQLSFGRGPDGETRVCLDAIVVDEPENDMLWKVEDQSIIAVFTLFVAVTSIVLFFTELFCMVLRHLNPPRFVAGVIAGAIMGPSVMGKSEVVSLFFYNYKTLPILRSIGNLALVYYMFTVGLEMDMAPLSRLGAKVLRAAIAGIMVPYFIAYTLYFSCLRPLQARGSMFFAGALSFTSFVDLAQILARRNILHTDIGKMALASATVQDLTGWVFLSFCLALHGAFKIYAIVATAIFAGVLLILIRPAISWLLSRTMRQGEACNEGQVCFILFGVIVCGIITDAFGVHAIVGAFVFGLCIRKGELRVLLKKKLDTYVSTLLLPSYFFSTGLRIDFKSIFETPLLQLAAMVILVCSAKSLGTLIVSCCMEIQTRESLALGVLLNTKGVVSVILLNLGRDLEIMGIRQFGTAVMLVILSTCMVEPFTDILWKSGTKSKHELRTIGEMKENSHFRVLICIQPKRNVIGMINLLEASNPTKNSPIELFTVQLVELTDRSSVMLIVHDSCMDDGGVVSHSFSDSDYYVIPFQDFERRCNGVTLKSLTSVSPFESMDGNVCSLAEEECVTLIILPFYMTSEDGGNNPYRYVFHNVLEKAPCSVGIFVDRGLRSVSEAVCSHSYHSEHGNGHHFALFFFGGRDDREALAYAHRMAHHASVQLTVIRFLPGTSIDEKHEIHDGHVTLRTHMEEERQLDDKYINEFLFKSMFDKSISYSIQQVDDTTDTVTAIRTMNHVYDMYIVGREPRTLSLSTSDLLELSDRPELGAIGDLLMSLEFASHASILIVQKYVSGRSVASSSRRQYLMDKYCGHMTWRPPI